MGKVQLFEIRLGDSRVVYSPGEPLAGTVTLRLAGALQYRGDKRTKAKTSQQIFPEIATPGILLGSGAGIESLEALQ
ncbi:hypothetical protein lerEdw1_006758 [Lerista edwardsae]|nr:hypothetical protein lerEdw1_006758 [Lerista edwardsae]